MDELWEKQLPREYLDHVIHPVGFEYHTEPTANAERVIGFDSQGDRCFYFHSFVLAEECFDIDELPIQIDIYYERVIAWRLRQGRWIKIKSFADKLDRCERQVTTLPVELVEAV